MISKEGRYILTVEDWYTIIKYFMLTPRTVAIKEIPSLTFMEYQVYDVYSKKTLFSFYNHDGKIRIPGDKNNVIVYEIDISQILTKNPEPIPQNILDSVKHKIRNNRATFAERVTNSSKTSRKKTKQSNNKN